MRSLCISLVLGLSALLAVPGVEALAAGTLDQSQTDNAAGMGVIPLQLSGVASDRPIGQTFTAGASGNLDRVRLWPLSNWLGNTIEIRTTENGLPTDDVLASATVGTTAIGQWIAVDFDPPALVSTDSRYAIVITFRLPFDPQSGWAVGVANPQVGDSYPGGEYVLTPNNSLDWMTYPDWTGLDFDLAFETYVSPADEHPPLVEVSGVVDGNTYTPESAPKPSCLTSDQGSGVLAPASLSLSGGPLGSITATCSGAIDNAGNAAAAVSLTYLVLYDWGGFRPPVDASDTALVVNRARAGQSIPIKFDLGGDQGLEVFGASPVSYRVILPEILDTAADVQRAAGSRAPGDLVYDADAGQYIFIFRTERSWAGTARMLELTLADGSTHGACFAFTR